MANWEDTLGSSEDKKDVPQSLSHLVTSEALKWRDIGSVESLTPDKIKGGGREPTDKDLDQVLYLISRGVPIPDIADTLKIEPFKMVAWLEEESRSADYVNAKTASREAIAGYILQVALALHTGAIEKPNTAKILMDAFKHLDSIRTPKVGIDDLIDNVPQFNFMSPPRPEMKKIVSEQ